MHRSIDSLRWTRLALIVNTGNAVIRIYGASCLVEVSVQDGRLCELSCRTSPLGCDPPCLLPRCRFDDLEAGWWSVLESESGVGVFSMADLGNVLGSRTIKPQMTLYAAKVIQSILNAQLRRVLAQTYRFGVQENVLEPTELAQSTKRRPTKQQLN